MVDPSHTFHIADYAVFAVTIVISLGIGIYYALSGDKQRTTSEYLVGGRAMQFLPVAISLMVSFESSIMMLGLPAEVYVYGIQWWMSCVGFFLSQIISIFIVVPLLHPLRITSAYEYLQLRFDSAAVRLLGSFLGILTYTWYMGIVLFGPALALEAVTGFPQWSSIFLGAVVAVIYTAIGGIKAVIWTDVFQAFIMYAGMFAVLLKGTIDVGGPAEVWNIAGEGGRLNFFNFDFDPRTRHTFWNLFFGSLIRGFGLAFNQSTVQRISATRTQREAIWVMAITAPAFFASLSMAGYEGIVAYSYYQSKGCDPLGANKISDPNQIIPFTVMDIFITLPGMPGLFLAALFSASLSTLSSGLSSLSALVWTDFIKPRIREVSDFTATVIAKVSVFVFGLLGCGIAILVSKIGGPLTQISGSLLAAFSGPLTGLFLLGCFCPWANSKGAFIGGLSALCLSSWLSLGKTFSKSVKKQPWLPFASTENCLANQSASFQTTLPSSSDFSSHMFNYSFQSHDNSSEFIFTVEGHGDSIVSALMATTTPELSVPEEAQGVDVIYTISYQWLAPIGIILTLFLGSLISLLTGGNKKPVDPRYLISFCDKLCCYMPKSIRKLFRCADDYSTVPVKNCLLDHRVTGKVDDEVILEDSEQHPVHDIFLDKEFIVTPPADETEKKGDPMIPLKEMDEPPTGSGLKNGKLPESKENGDTFISYNDDVNLDDIESIDASQSQKSETNPATDENEQTKN